MNREELIKNKIGQINQNKHGYAEEQLEHAEEQENRCYSKECPNNKENKCVQYCDGFICLDRIAKPINYEEEYKKVKMELEAALKGNGYLEIEIKNRTKECENIKEQLEILRKEAVGENERLKKTLFEQETENKKLRCQYEEAQQHIINLKHQLKENKEKLDNYKAIKSLMKILSEGL